MTRHLAARRAAGGSHGDATPRSRNGRRLDGCRGPRMGDLTASRQAAADGTGADRTGERACLTRERRGDAACRGGRRRGVRVACRGERGL